MIAGTENRSPSVFEVRQGPSALDVLREGFIREVKALACQIDAKKAQIAAIEQMIAVDKNGAGR